MAHTPPLWLGMDPDAPNHVAAAWRAMWDATSSDAWIPFGTMIGHGRRAAPELKNRTLSSLGVDALRRLEVRTIEGTNRREVRRP